MNRVAIHPKVVLVIAATCMLAAAIGGADFGHYRAWVGALDTGDIFQIGSEVGSPLGVPVTQWSHGPGLVYVVPQVVLRGAVDGTSASLIAGWLSVLVFWWAFLRILGWASRGSLLLTAFGASVAFLGTHVGYYTRAHASESLALALVALLVASVVCPDRRFVSASWLVGCSAALLIITRSHYVVYAGPALLVAAGRILGLEPSGLGIDPAADGETTEGWRRWAAAAALSLPIMMAVFQQALVNRWMTGSPGASPYVFGGEGFHSVDWLHPLLSTVLTHPWHGLLVYHPLYGLALAAAGVCLVRAGSRRERVLWLGAITAIVVNLWVQASWYVWWLGTGTFGMRGMAPAAVLLVPALVRVITDAHRDEGGAGPTSRRSWTVAALVCCIWSLLMLLQGTTQFLTWPAVFAGQGSAIAGLLDVRWLVATAGSVILVVGCWLWARRVRLLESADPLLVAVTGTLCAQSLAYLFLSAHMRWDGAAAGLFLPAVMMLVLLGSISVFLRVAGGWAGFRGREAWESGTDSGEVAHSLVSLWIGVFLLIGTALFARLAFITETRLAAGDLPDRTYAHVATFRVDQTLNGFREYLRVSGFDERKEALHRFLRSQGIAVRPYPGTEADPGDATK